MAGGSTTNGAAASGGKKKKKTNKPNDNPFTQQNLPAWQPTLAPLYVAVLFFLITLVFSGIGTALVITTENVQEVIKYYDQLCDPAASRDSNGSPYCTTEVEFTVTTKMTKPYLYYYLENFYQNHRRYSVSRSDRQLGGSIITASDASSQCQGKYAAVPANYTGEIEENQVYNPCGLIAWSMFNDTISIKKRDDNGNVTTICNGERPIGSSDPEEGAQCTKFGIAWSSDRTVKFKAPETRVNRVHPETYLDEAGHMIPNATDEDFMVWMRTAALPNFRKLYRILTVDLEPGTYYFDIKSRYPVSGFGGKKAAILTTTSVFGGKNRFLYIAYFSVAAICLFLTVVFVIAGIIQKIRSKMAMKKHRQA